MKKLSTLILLLVATNCILQASSPKFTPAEIAKSYNFKPIVTYRCLDSVPHQPIARNKASYIKYRQLEKDKHKAQSDRMHNYFHHNNHLIIYDPNMPDILEDEPNDDIQIIYGNANIYQNMRNAGHDQKTCIRRMNQVLTSSTKDNTADLKFTLKSLGHA